MKHSLEQEMLLQKISPKTFHIAPNILLLTKNKRLYGEH